MKLNRCKILKRKGKTKWLYDCGKVTKSIRIENNVNRIFLEEYNEILKQPYIYVT